ncbi:MAG: SAM-dependent methyltransferase [Methanobacterium sp.]|nr:SAM-dependent methyltransferase [Methanobacterium sp.]
MYLDQGIIFILLIFISIMIFILLWVIWSDLIGAGFEPTSRRRVIKMLTMAGVNSDDLVYDLGSGDGRIVIEAARKFKAQSVGIEADPIRYIWSQMMVVLLGLRRRVSILWGNFFWKDISKATVVTLFLSQKANYKLQKKLELELQPGTRVVSYFWTFTSWDPVMVDEEEHIYMYII